MAGTRIADMPDLGVVTDASSVVCEKSGSGLFLATALRSYMFDGAPIATIAALRLNTALSKSVLVSGFAAAGDGGGGWFNYVSTDTTSSDNGGTIIVDASSRRWYRQTNGSKLKLAWFGGFPSVSNNATALNAALATLTTTGGTIEFGRGQYTFTSTITYALPAGLFSVGFEGVGDGGTVLYWPSGNGMALNASDALHSVHFKDLTIATNATGTVVGVTCTNTVQGGSCQQSDFERVTFRGIDGGGSAKYWGTGLSVVGWCFFNYISCVWYGWSGYTGVGLSVAGDAAGSFKYSLVHNIIGCTLNNLGSAFVYGTYVQGVAIEGTNFTNNATSVYVPATSVGGALLAVTNSQMAGIPTGTGAQILVAGDMAGLMVNNCMIFVMQPGQIGIAINGLSGQCTITGNVITGQTVLGVAPAGSVGLYATASCYANVISGNAFYGLTFGMNFTGSSANWVSSGNVFYTVGTNITAAGSNQLDNTLPSLTLPGNYLGGTYVSTLNGVAITGIKSGYALDMLDTILPSHGAIRIPNGSYISGRNVSNNGDLVALQVTTGDNINIGNATSTNYLIGNTEPSANNTYSLGSTTNKFVAVWAVNGTIQTSDPSLKTDIATLPSCLPLVMAIDPHTYRWIDGGSEMVDVAEPQSVQEEREISEEVTVIVVEDGKPVRRTVTQTRLEPVFDTVAVLGDDGEPLFDLMPSVGGRPPVSLPITHQVPRMVTKMVTTKTPVSKPGKRLHWGFLADEVKLGMAATGLDFGGYVKGSDGTEALRYDQLLPVAWKAIQELAAKVAALEAAKP